MAAASASLRLVHIGRLQQIIFTLGPFPLAAFAPCLRAGRVPELATALSSGRIGYEAAYLLSRVVTPATAKDWICRAERRTVKHLREEVEAAELLIRMGLGRDQPPLDEPSLGVMFELEQCIASGDFGRSGDNKAGDCSEREPAGTKDGRGERWYAGQMSGVRRAASGAIFTALTKGAPRPSRPGRASLGASDAPGRCGSGGEHAFRREGKG